MALSLLLPDPPFQPLATERLLLRPLQPEDALEVHRLVNDWAVVRMLSRLPFPYPRKLTDEWIAKHDPDFQRAIEEEQELAEEKFITGPNGPGKRKPGTPIH